MDSGPGPTSRSADPSSGPESRGTHTRGSLDRRPPARATPAPAPRWRRPAGWLDRVFELVADSSYGTLLGSWVAMVLLFGAIYWAASWSGAGALLQAGAPVAHGPAGFFTAIYFSFVTATSVGFGDVVPIGIARFAAIVEAAAGLLLFGCIISKLVTRRTDRLIEDTHSLAFEERLGRVRTDLHIVLTELQSLSILIAEGTQPPDRIGPRMESAAMVFGGELRSIHDLLFRPQEAPDESVLEAILASLGASLREMVDLVGHLPEPARGSPVLGSALHTISRFAEEICGDCVPRQYAPEMKVWMDRIRDLARQLEPVGR